MANKKKEKEKMFEGLGKMSDWKPTQARLVVVKTRSAPEAPVSAKKHL